MPPRTCTDCERCVCGAADVGGSDHVHFKLSPSKHPLAVTKHDAKERL